MFIKLFLAFTLIPAFEIFLFIHIGQKIGLINTLILVILSGFVGAWLARMQGLRTLQKIQAALAQGVTPAEELVNGVIILVAGIVLLTPGFFTDTLGLLLLFPPSRYYFKRYLRYKFDQWIKNGNVHITQFRR